MSRKLFLIRHANAVEKDSNQKDFDRLLTSEGMREANRQGQRLAGAEIVPDLFLSSPAIRAEQTAMEIAERLKFENNRIQFDDDLYEASIRTLLKTINEIDDQYKTVFIVAHNPGISYLSEYLTREDIGNVVPAGIVELRCDADSWTEVSEGTAHLENYWLPQ